MSTRCTTRFIQGDPNQPDAIIYRHSDGYPEGAGADIHRFFAAVEAATSDHRYSQPSYLAAKYLVWLAESFARRRTFDRQTMDWTEKKADRLDFLSVAPMTREPLDVEYIYIVDCSNYDSCNRPTVTCYPKMRSDTVNGLHVLVPGSEIEIPKPN